MALETPDAIHACGAFVGVVPVPPPFASVPPEPTDNQITSNGIKSFLRTGVGSYQITLEQPINGAEAIVHCSAGVNFTGTIQAQVNDLPLVPPSLSPETAVFVNAYDANQNPVDVTFFDVIVVKVPGSKSLALPVAPAPEPGGLGLPFSAAVITGPGTFPLAAGVINQVNANGALTVQLPAPGVTLLPNTRRVLKDIVAAVEAGLVIDGNGALVEDPTTGLFAATFAPGNATGLYLAYQYDGTVWRVVGYSAA